MSHAAASNPPEAPAATDANVPLDAIDGALPERTATAQTHRGTGTLRPPTDRWFWAVLEGLPASVGPYALDAAFERWIPLPIERVETRYARMARGTFLACGIPAATLRTMIEEADARGHTAESIRPAALPAWAFGASSNGPARPSTEPAIDPQDDDGAGISPTPAPAVDQPEPPPTDPRAAARLLAQLEFRSGRFQSPRSARIRRAKVALIAACMALSTAALAGGTIAKARADRRDAQAARSAISALASDALGPPRGASAALDPSLRLSAALRLAEATRARGAAVAASADRARDFQSLLAAWPAEPLTRVLEVRIDQGQLVVRSQFKAAEDAERLALALDGSMPGWSLRSHGVSKARDAFESTAVFGPAPQEASR